MVRILAKDVDGLELKRASEAVAVVLRIRGVVAQTIQSIYSPESQLYTAEVAGLTVAGTYSVAVQTPLGSYTKATFTVVCAAGYEAAQGGECIHRQSSCATATLSTNRVAFIARDTLQLSSLGSASAVELLPVTQTTRVDVRAGQVSIIFERPGSFLVQVIAFDGQRCTLGLPRLVECPNGYQAVNGACQPVVAEDVCAGLVVRDNAGVPIDGRRQDGLQFPPGDLLRVSLSSSKPASAYRIKLVPLQGTVTGSIADGIVLGQTGPHMLSVEYSVAGSPARQCPLIAALNVTVATIDR